VFGTLFWFLDLNFIITLLIIIIIFFFLFSPTTHVHHPFSFFSFSFFSPPPTYPFLFTFPTKHTSPLPHFSPNNRTESKLLQYLFSYAFLFNLFFLHLFSSVQNPFVLFGKKKPCHLLQYLHHPKPTTSKTTRGELESIDSNLPSLVSVLRSVGAVECWHKHGSFLDHLVDIYRILKIWKAPNSVCLCCLFHSLTPFLSFFLLFFFLLRLKIVSCISVCFCFVGYFFVCLLR
jgi:hypothetical protein